MWAQLQEYLDFCSAIRLSGEGAIVYGLGLHPPYSTIPFCPPQAAASSFGSKLLRTSSIHAFESVCKILYIKMHAFTSMRRILCETLGSADFSDNAASIEAAIFAALSSLT